MRIEEDHVLAIDLGIRAGFALFQKDGKLVWYRSRNFGSRARMKAYAHTLLHEIPNLKFIIVEGGGNLYSPWFREAQKLSIKIKSIGADIWRQDILTIPRQVRSGSTAKQTAIKIARVIIQDNNLPRPTSLRHDAAEAILVGHWAINHAKII